MKNLIDFVILNNVFAEKYIKPYKSLNNKSINKEILDAVGDCLIDNIPALKMNYYYKNKSDEYIFDSFNEFIYAFKDIDENGNKIKEKRLFVILRSMQNMFYFGKYMETKNNMKGFLESANVDLERDVVVINYDEWIKELYDFFKKEIKTGMILENNFDYCTKRRIKSITVSYLLTIACDYEDYIIREDPFYPKDIVFVSVDALKKICEKMKTLYPIRKNKKSKNYKR